MEKYNKLIIRYLSNIASDTEIAELLVWIKSNNENKLYFVNYCNTWHNLGLLDADKRYKKDVAFKRFITEINSDNKKITKEISFLNFKKDYTKIIYAASSIAAIFILVMSVMLFSNKSNNIEYLANINNETMNIKLVDGSKVLLSENATVEYPKVFDDERRIVLEGKAFFDVTKDSLKPFIVETNISLIQVLGTSFEVETFNDSTIITVNSGKVRVFHKENSSFVDLMAGEKAVCVIDESRIFKNFNEDLNYFSWKTNTLYFENTKMLQVASDLERHFGLDFDFKDESIKNCNLSAKFVDMSLNEIIQILELTFGIIITENDGSYIISGKSC